MAPLNRHLLGSSITVLFSLLGFVFALVAITSKEWAQRHEYNTTDPVQWSKTEYTLYRSPFIICSAQAGNVSCQHFHPFGKDTSCEAISITGDVDATNSGDERLCQQIHLAGHFAIASTTLISVGFLLSLALFAFAIMGSSRSAGSDTGAGGGGEGQGKHRGHHDQHEGMVEASDSTAPLDGGLTSKPPLGAAGWSSYGSLLMLVCLCIGVTTGLLCQFYTILGLIQSAPNNADFASSSGIADPSLRHYDSWYQGKALSTYETCAWGFAAVGALIATRTWKLPEWY
jgi:hypothetical protein